MWGISFGILEKKFKKGGITVGINNERLLWYVVVVKRRGNNLQVILVSSKDTSTILGTYASQMRLDEPSKTTALGGLQWGHAEKSSLGMNLIVMSDLAGNNVKGDFGEG